MSDIDIRQSITRLKSANEARRSKQVTWRILGRNHDPRTARGTSATIRETREYLTDTGHPLKTNHPESYLLLMMHLLTGEPVRWKMPHSVDITPEERLQYGKNERAVAAILRETITD